MTTRMMRRIVSPCIAIALLFLLITACGEAETEPAAPAPQPTTAVVTQNAAAAPTAPAAAPIVATPTAATQAQAAMSESGPAKITVAAPFAPSNNGAIETDDSFLLSRAGVTETLIKIDFDGQVKPYLAEVLEPAG